MSNYKTLYEDVANKVSKVANKLVDKGQLCKVDFPTESYDLPLGHIEREKEEDVLKLLKKVGAMPIYSVLCGKELHINSNASDYTCRKFYEAVKESDLNVDPSNVTRVESLGKFPSSGCDTIKVYDTRIYTKSSISEMNF